MAQDFARKSSITLPQPNKKTSGRPWGRIIAGLLVVALALFFVWLKRSNLVDSIRFSKSEATRTTHPSRAHHPAPEFDFYQTLSQEDGAHAAPQQAQPTPTTTSTLEKPLLRPHLHPATPVVQKQYFLQVASFRRSTDADHLKAQLVLSGFDVNIQRAHRGSTDWHRVMVGPFAKKPLARKKQQQLHALKFETLLISKQRG